VARLTDEHRTRAEVAREVCEGTSGPTPRPHERERFWPGSVRALGQYGLSWSAVVGALLLFGACTEPSSRRPAPDTAPVPTGSTDSTGSTGATGDTGDTGDTATTEPPPLDVIVLVDGSADMGLEAEAVESRLNGLYTALDEAGRRPQLTLLAPFGTVGSQICVPPPLGRANCDQAPETEPFLHLDADVQSWDAWCQLIDGLPRFASRLREDAPTVVVQITTDWAFCGDVPSSLTPEDAETAADAFTAALTAASPPGLGSLDDGQLTFVSVVGIEAPASPQIGLPPEDPVTTRECNTADRPGLAYQVMSRRTGRQRYSTCDLALRADALFDALASELIAIE